MKNRYVALVVDDDPANREEIAAYLKNMGHSFEEAASVQAAKEMLEVGAFDYVVLDMCIPVETGNPYSNVKFGKTLLHHVLDKFEKSLPILVVSGVAKSAGDIVEIMKLRSEGVMVSYVIKPFNSEHNSDIIKEIEGLLKEKSKMAGAASGKMKKRSKKPLPDGSDLIDIDCRQVAWNLYEIKVNGKPVAVGERALNVFLCFGKAQRKWSGRKNERFNASLSLEELDTTAKKDMTVSDMTSLFSKIKTKTWPFLRCSILDGEKDSAGKRVRERWILGAMIINLEKGEQFFKH